MNQTYGIVAVTAAVLATLVIGAAGLRISRTTSDFYVASRTVPPHLNAMAISGEYLSAASFLGIAGLVVAQGLDMLWFPVGYAAGYLVLLVFVAAPLRRSGAYTLSDFAESRLESKAARRVASVLVVGVGWLYLLPQFQGAGLTLGLVTGAPGWLGGVLVAVVVTLAVAAGGMRSITFVQAFQYCLKVIALLVPALFLVLAWLGDPRPVAALDEPPAFREQTRVTVEHTVRVRIQEPLTVGVTGTVDGARHDGDPVALGTGVHEITGGTTLRFPPKARVPQRESDAGPREGASSWAAPLSGGRDAHPLYTTYGVIVATFLGTMGLPHVLVRFYTNPDGRAARRTTVIVLALVGGFYLLPPLYGFLGRIYAPDLVLTGNTDAAVLVLPERVIGGVGGDLLGALVAAGACAAFLSTASGLTLSVAGVLSQDVLPSLGVRHFRLATLIAVAVPVTVSMAAGGLPVANAVGLAFAVAASSFCPLLVLGIWWRGLTAPGAVAGLLTGGGSALTAVALTIAGPFSDGWAHTLLAWPAVWTVPLAFGTMILVSLATRNRIPAGTDLVMARLHLPEERRAEEPSVRFRPVSNTREAREAQETRQAVPGPRRAEHDAAHGPDPGT
ncbi:cation acetate symporter [Streptomyces sp. NPDC090025]|uniref:sodium/solute symporter n=1 Tax=Streptomyces sp. NPDC090025 TaxID=3365922 RepID=UPI003836C4E9